ncbi:MAG: hypothetical protein HGA98_03305 [Deltaproteobacteria bacterium]|nr:hypothetical protein [Deltaproteobacteria bacterium]
MLAISVVGALASASLLACAPAKVVKQWSDPARSGPGYKKVLVMTVWEEARPRRTFEDQFASEFKALGVDAVPSYQFIPEDGKVSRERVIQAVDDSGADAVIITKLTGRTEHTSLSEGDFWEYSAGVIASEDVGTSYTVAWAAITPSVRETDMTVWSVESKLFDARSRKPVWVGMSTVREPGNLYRGTALLARAIFKALTERKLL